MSPPDLAGTIMTTTHSRKLHSLVASVAFLGAAGLFSVLTQRPIDLARAAIWSIAGIGLYVLLCGVFGFDPHRTRIAAHAPALWHYVDRWELRLGQATLSMLGCIVLAARLLAPPEQFVTAVVSATLSAWMYFVVRWYAGSYRSDRRVRA